MGIVYNRTRMTTTTTAITNNRYNKQSCQTVISRRAILKALTPQNAHLLKNLGLKLKTKNGKGITIK